MSYSSEVLADAPLVYYRMEESSGQPQDSSGNARNTTTTEGAGSATYLQATPILSDPADTSIRLNGSFVFGTPDSAALDLVDGPLSMECWFRRTTSGIFEEHLIRKQNGAYNMGIIDNILSLVKAGTAVVAHASISITDTIWHHCVMTKSGAARFIYIDGVDRTVLDVDQTFIDSANALLTGGKTGGGDALNGYIDEVAVYNTVLSAARVLAHYNAALTSPGLGDNPPVGILGRGAGW